MKMWNSQIESSSSTSSSSSHYNHSDFSSSPLITSSPTVLIKLLTAVPQTNSSDFYYHCAYKGDFNNFITTITALDDENKTKETDHPTLAAQGYSSNNSVISPIQKQSCNESRQEAAIAISPSTGDVHHEEGTELRHRYQDTESTKTEATSSSSLLLLLPGVRDRRKIIELNMVPLFHSCNSDMSTEIGSGSRPGSSAGSHSPSAAAPSTQRIDAESPLTSSSALSPSASFRDVRRDTSGKEMTSNTSTVGTALASSHHLSSPVRCTESVETAIRNARDHYNSPFLLRDSFERLFDNDPTPENRFHSLLRAISVDSLSQSNHSRVIIAPSSNLGHRGQRQKDGAQDRPRRCAEPSEQYISPSFHSVVDSGTGHSYVSQATGLSPTFTASTMRIQSMNGCVTEPPLCAAVRSEESGSLFDTADCSSRHVHLIASKTSTVPLLSHSNSTSEFTKCFSSASPSVLGAPSSHDCLTDATTADGNPEYDDDDLGESECSSALSSLDLPFGVSKKVRFLPVEQSSIYVYEQFDWYDESDQIGILVTESELSDTSQTNGHRNICSTDGENPDDDDDDDDDDDAIHADPLQLFIPLIGPNRVMKLTQEIEDREESSSAQRLGSDGDWSPTLEQQPRVPNERLKQTQQKDDEDDDGGDAPPNLERPDAGIHHLVDPNTLSDTAGLQNVLLSSFNRTGSCLSSHRALRMNTRQRESKHSENFRPSTATIESKASYEFQSFRRSEVFTHVNRSIDGTLRLKENKSEEETDSLTPHRAFFTDTASLPWNSHTGSHRGMESGQCQLHRMENCPFDEIVPSFIDPWNRCVLQIQKYSSTLVPSIHQNPSEPCFCSAPSPLCHTVPSHNLHFQPEKAPELDDAMFLNCGTFFENPRMKKLKLATAKF